MPKSPKSKLMRKAVGQWSRIQQAVNPRHSRRVQQKSSEGNRENRPPEQNLDEAQKPTGVPLKLTLGVEFEILVIKYFDHGVPEQADLEYAMKLVYELLKDRIRARCFSCGDWHDFHLPLNPMMPGLLEADVSRMRKATSDFSKWTVMAEGTVKLETKDYMQLFKTCEKAQVFAVELVARKMHIDHALRTTKGCAVGASGWHSIGYEEEVQAVLQALQDAFNTPGGNTRERSGTRMLVNSTSGLHVHVGNERKGLPLQTVKNIMKIHTAFERTIDSMTAVTRIGGTELAQLHLEDSKCDSPGLSHEHPIEGLHSGVYNQPMSSYFLASARKTRARQQHYHTLIPDRSRYPESHLNAAQLDTMGSSFEPRDWIKLIELAPSIHAIQTMIQPDSHKAVLNPENLDAYQSPRNDTIKMTMEFRQQKAAITAEETLPWIAFVRSLVEFAHNSDGTTLDRWCSAECDNPIPDLDGFLTAIDVSPATKVYWLQRTSLDADAMAAIAEADDLRTDASGLQHPLRAFVKYLTQQQCDDRSATAVRTAIETKLRRGGYGRFSQSYLDALPFLDESAKTKLLPDFEPLILDELSFDDDLWDEPVPYPTDITTGGLRASNVSRWADPETGVGMTLDRSNVSRWAGRDETVTAEQGQRPEMPTVGMSEETEAGETVRRSNRSRRGSSRSNRNSSYSQ